MEVLGLVLIIGVTFSCASPMQRKDHCQPPQRMELEEVFGDLQETFPSEHILTYNCRPGYMHFGPKTKMVCRNGAWHTHSRAHCRRRSCGNPGDIEFGTFEMEHADEFVFGAIVKYSCNPGYEMISKYNTIECAAKGWSRVPPFCEAKLCPPIVDPSVRISFPVPDDEYTVGHVITLQCTNPNNNLYGPSQIYCTSNGTWNVNPPTCKGSCIVQNDKMEEHKIRVKTSTKLIYAHNEIIEFECIPGYEILDPKKLTIRCNIQGMITYPMCYRRVAALLFRKKKCPPPPAILFGESMGEKKFAYDSGSIVHYKCMSYFKRIGRENIRCLNGAWEIPPKCNQPCILNDLYIHGNNTVVKGKEKYILHGDNVTFDCLPTFKIPENKTLTTKCSKGKLKYPRCVKIKPCALNHRIILKNHIIPKKSDIKRIKENETIEFKCLPGYDISDYKNLKVKCHNEVIEYPNCFEITADETTIQPSVQTEILTTDYTRI